MAHKVVGTYLDNEVTLLDEPIITPNKRVQAGDILELDGEFVRLYEDGQRGLRYWFCTAQVIEAQVNRHTAVIVQGMHRQFAGQQAHKHLNHRLSNQAVAS